MTGRLHIGVLGPVVVTGPDGPLDLGPRRRSEVLAALVVDAGRVVPYEVLLDRVWGETGVPATMHGVVSRLRGALRTAEERPLLVTEPAGYRLDDEVCEIDAAGLASGLVAARRLLAEGRLEPARRAAADALALWRGRPYLDVRGEFARLEADRLDEQRLACHELLAEADLALGRHDGLLDTLPGLVTEHPLREALRGALMLALYRAGRQADALAVYETGRRLLADELGVDPGADLQRLWGRMLQQDPALDVVRPAPAEVSEPPAPSVPTPPVTPVTPVTSGDDAPPLVGRDHELAALREVVAAAAGGTPSAALLVGEPGIGKTHLVEALRDGLEADGSAVVVAGACWDGGAGALWPWEQALDGLAGQVGVDALRAALTEPQAAELAVLVPGLGETGPADGGVGAARARVRLFDAVARALTAGAGERPVVVVLEDLHWADPETLALVDYLLATVRSGRLALVGTTRPDDAATRLEAAVGRARGTVLALQGLEVGDVDALVSHHLGTPLRHGVALTLRERTDGNPFYLVELTRLLDQERQRGGRADVPVPRSVGAVVESRLRVLAAGDRDVLGAAAVLGREFDVPLLGTVLARPVADVADAVDRATGLGLLEPAATAGGQRFAHALVQEVLEASVGPVRRATWHAQAAEALVARHGAEPEGAALAHRVAHHYLSAGLLGDPAAAVGAALRAARVASRRLALADAEHLLRRALDLAPQLPPAEGEPLELEVRLRLAALLSQSAGYESAEVVEQRARAVELAGRVGTTEQRVLGQWGRFGSALVAGELATADAAVEAMAAADLGAPPWLEVAEQQAFGQLRLLEGRLDEARDHLAAGLARAAGLTDAPLEVFAQDPVAVMHGWSAFTLTVASDDDGTLSAADAGAADAAAERLDHPYTTAYLDILQAWRAVWLGRPDEARARAERARRTAEEAGFGPFETFALPPLAWALAQADDVDAARTASRAAAADYLDDGRHMFGTLVAAVVADVEVAAGDHAAALTVLDRAVALSEESGERVVLARLHGQRAACLDALGRPAEATAARAARDAVVAEQGCLRFAAGQG
ncbi:hypothetical protein GCM10023340_10810 [Nocardioides marinquilinus]|uniref:OmpR/PhoB-type domain-containing protein n=1 Tax=Nocardioides marinquilinus TaxID=1210400 RepID=A0ABP9PC35_9ACTN